MDSVSDSSSKRSQKRRYFAGLGLDLLRVARVQRFLKTYGSERFQRILTPLEKASLYKRKISALEFARRFTAKEAYFKSLNAPWLGVDGFSKIHVEMLSKNYFSASWINEKGVLEREASGCFFRGPRWVAAQVIRWK